MKKTFKTDCDISFFISGNFFSLTETRQNYQNRKALRQHFISRAIKFASFNTHKLKEYKIKLKFQVSFNYILLRIKN